MVIYVVLYSVAQATILLVITYSQSGVFFMSVKPIRTADSLRQHLRPRKSTPLQTGSKKYKHKQMCMKYKYPSECYGLAEDLWKAQNWFNHSSDGIRRLRRDQFEPRNNVTSDCKVMIHLQQRTFAPSAQSWPRERSNPTPPHARHSCIWLRIWTTLGQCIVVFIYASQFAPLALKLALPSQPTPGTYVDVYNKGCHLSLLQLIASAYQNYLPPLYDFPLQLPS